MSNETPAPGGYDEVGRLTQHTDDEQYQAEPTDPTIFSGHADTRKSVNVWQFKVVLAIAAPFLLLGITGKNILPFWSPLLGNLLVGLTLGMLVYGTILAWRYKRGKED